MVVHAEPYSGVPAEVLAGLGDGIEIEAVFALRSSHKSFGGLSGLWVAPDGESLVAVSDIGQRWQARLQHDETGRLIGLDGWSVGDLVRRPEDGDGSRWIDAESLSDDGQGGLIVAYEGKHRLRRWALDSLDAVPEPVRLPHGLGGPSNSGIEALSDLEGGRLFAVGERVGAWGGEGLMGWVIDATSADDLIYIPGAGLAPTGADRLDDRVYVVERSFSLLGGFYTRIVSLASDAIRPGARLEGTQLAAFRWGRLGENFEGISARRGPDGNVVLYLLADDNFSFLQDTLLVQMSLTTTGAVN
ncbi:MAG: esterase-like activity of phytase family protein [Pseudomonadota bacterium]